MISNRMSELYKNAAIVLWGPYQQTPENGLFLKFSPRLSLFQRTMYGVSKVSPALPSSDSRFQSEGAFWGPEVEVGGRGGGTGPLGRF